MKRLGTEPNTRLMEICSILNIARVLDRTWAPDSLREMATIRERYEQREFCRACIAAGIVTPYPILWRAQTLREIVRNPFFAGRMSRRKKTPGGRKHTKLNWTEYDISERDGGWPTVISYEGWVELQGRIGETKRQGRAVRSGLLTRILHCSQGQPMCLDGASGYSCPCQYTLETHAGMEASRPKWEDWTRQIVVGALEALPLDALHWSPEVTRGDIALTELKAQHARAVQAQNEAQTQASNLMLERSNHIELFGQDAYQVAAARVRAQVEAAGRDVERLGRMLRQPDIGKLTPLLQAVREMGAAALWEEADFTVRRAAVEGIIARIDIVALLPGKRYFTGAKVTFQDWVLECLPAHQPPPIVGKRGNGKMGKNEYGESQ